MGSLDSKIASHNRKVLADPRSNTVGCNCINKVTCPMDGQCNWKDIVYEAEVCLENQARGEGMLYLGQASGPWKLRYNNHTKAFRNRSQRAHCELANHV